MKRSGESDSTRKKILQKKRKNRSDEDQNLDFNWPEPMKTNKKKKVKTTANHLEPTSWKPFNLDEERTRKSSIDQISQTIHHKLITGKKNSFL